MDVFHTIASKRDTRTYGDRPVPDDVVTRILNAGRVAGSARNRQPWTFVVVESAGALERLADTVYEPANIRGASLVIAVVSKAGFDGGRAAQNMMLAAWGEGVASCPNGMPDPEKTAEAVGLSDDEQPLIVLSFGYPAKERDPSRRTAEEWSAGADRKSLDELVRRV